MTRAHFVFVASLIYPITSWANQPNEPTSLPCQSGCWPSSAMSIDLNKECKIWTLADQGTTFDQCMVGYCNAPSAKPDTTIRDCVMSSCADEDNGAIQVMVKQACGIMGSTIVQPSSGDQPGAGASATTPGVDTTSRVTTSGAPQIPVEPSIRSTPIPSSVLDGPQLTSLVAATTTPVTSPHDDGGRDTAASMSISGKTTADATSSSVVPTSSSATHWTTDGGIAASQSTTTSALVTGSVIHSQTPLHPSATVIGSAVAGSIAFLAALVTLYLYLRKRENRGGSPRERVLHYQQGVTRPRSGQTTNTVSTSEVSQAVLRSTSFGMAGNVPVTRATNMNNHRPSLVEDQPLLRHSTASSSFIASFAYASMSDIPEPDSHTLRQPTPIADDCVSIDSTFSVAHGEIIASGGRGSEFVSSAVCLSAGYTGCRDTVISDDLTTSDASSIGWHPNRMVRSLPRTAGGSVSSFDEGDVSEGCRYTGEGGVTFGALWAF
ncbi:hypothetical protein GY45DRAFT_206937 [Cubamyces sp. BRFM 1775]|nr:hypothetical protein GY45DRAFT_206937 [Cubamyces sp. BRFM 1775]